MAKSPIETKIYDKGYVSAGSARAAVSRAGLSPTVTARLHALADSVYGEEEVVPKNSKAVDDFKSNGQGPTHPGRMADAVEDLAFRVMRFAIGEHVGIVEALELIRRRIEDDE